MSRTAELIREHGLIADVRSPVAERLFDWAIAVASGGIKLLGIPVTFHQVTELTSDLADAGNLHVGVTGVVKVDDVAIAVAAGADFIVSPIFDPDIINAAKSRGIDVIAGASTPSEIRWCIDADPALVAVYPAGAMGGGAAYFKELVRLFPNTPLLAAGGVDVEQAPNFLEVGAAGAIVDAGVFPTDDDASAAEVITMRALALTEVCGEIRGLGSTISMTDILTRPPLS